MPGILYYVFIGNEASDFIAKFVLLSLHNVFALLLRPSNGVVKIMALKVTKEGFFGKTY